MFSTLTKRFSNLSVNYRYRLGHGTVVRHQDDDRCVPFIDNLREGSGSRRHENLADSILKTVHRLLINTQDPVTLTCEFYLLTTVVRHQVDDRCVSFINNLHHHQPDDRCVSFIDNLREGSGSRRHENLADSILKTVHRLLINTQDPLTLTCELPPHDGSSTSSS